MIALILADVISVINMETNLYDKNQWVTSLFPMIAFLDDLFICGLQQLIQVFFLKMMKIILKI